MDSMDEDTKAKLAEIRAMTKREVVVVNGKPADEKPADDAKPTVVDVPVVATLGNTRRERWRAKHLPKHLPKDVSKHDWSKLPAWAREELLRLMRELAEMDSIVQAARGKGPTQIEATWNYRSGGAPDLWIPDYAQVRFLDTSRKAFRRTIDVSLVLSPYKRERDNAPPEAKAVRVRGGSPLRIKPVASNVVEIEVED